MTESAMPAVAASTRGVGVHQNPTLDVARFPGGHGGGREVSR
jgi:hypothetical protein